MDFDGVIHSYTSGWKGADKIPDPPVPGAFDFLAMASNYFEVHIFSSRTHQQGGSEAMQNWIWKEVTGSDYDPDNTCCVPVWVLKLKFPENKPPAMISIDDRAITFTGIFPDPKELLNFKPWNKK
jgi:hypothetical protein